MASIYVRFDARAEGAAKPARSLERLLASAASFTRVIDWRADAFRSIMGESDVVPGVGAAALIAGAGSVPGAWACVATPVHLLAGMHHVSFAADSILTLQEREADCLISTFNAAWSDAGIRLHLGRSMLPLCVFDRALDVSAHDPARALGHDAFDFQPSGRDAAALRRLMSEIEMWLHQHPLNAERTSRGIPAVTGLWLWGGGKRLARRPEFRGWVIGDDPMFAALGDAPASYDGLGAGVCVSPERPGSPGWSAVDALLKHAVRALRAGRIDCLKLSSGSRRYDVRHVRWRAWLRGEPWWRAFESD